MLGTQTQVLRNPPGRFESMKARAVALPVVGNPVPNRRIKDPDQVDQVRRLDCRAYDRCLDLAVENGWRGFHCNECRGYEAPNPDEQRRDMMGALTLLAETQLLADLAHEPVFVDETEDAADEADDDDGDDAAPSTAPRVSTDARN